MADEIDHPFASATRPLTCNASMSYWRFNEFPPPASRGRGRYGCRTCPNCKSEIRLTESLAAPLLEQTKAEFRRQLSASMLLPLQNAGVALEVVGAADAEASYSADRRLSVLLADDHAVNRRVVEMILANLDVDIVSVEDGAEALAMFKAQHFDIVLMDMMMPVMDGLAANRAIRQHELEHQLGRTPILMLTANVLPEHVQSALESGADRHIPKPITADRLIGSMGEVLDGAPVERVLAA